MFHFCALYGFDIPTRSEKSALNVKGDVLLRIILAIPIAFVCDASFDMVMEFNSVSHWVWAHPVDCAAVLSVDEIKFWKLY